MQIAMDNNKIINWSIFYSWQSDLGKENKNSIEKALRNALNDIQNDHSNIRLRFDEATRGEPGSPDIAETIFQKISAADIFVCDLTTINAMSSPEPRKVPNPNVSIELGYAIAMLGWARIILIFNEVHGKFPEDIPFDIGKRRALKTSIKGKEDKNGIAVLKQSLVAAIKIIIDKKPPKPLVRENFSPTEEKRNRDIINLRWALNAIHIPSMDCFLKEIPFSINGKIDHFWSDFEGVMRSSDFHLYDELAAKLIKKFLKHWQNIMFYLQSNPYYYNAFNGLYIFKPLTDNEGQKVLKLIIKERNCLSRALKDFLDYIRKKYLEINTDETSRYAITEYLNFQKEFNKNTENE